jgi:hypothetical protein
MAPNTRDEQTPSSRATPESTGAVVNSWINMWERRRLLTIVPIQQITNRDARMAAPVATNTMAASR